MRKAAICTVLLAGTLGAQDTRFVSEPQIPPACTMLTAQLSAPRGIIPEASEAQPDTARIQQAIDGCAAGKSVELKAAGAKQIFLAGPLRLKAGVTLLVDANTALAASRNPRDYDSAPGICGVVAERGGRGCKPWILAENAPGSGIMGDGVIDGRGGAKLIGQNTSWWDLAHEAKVKDQAQSVPRMLVVRQSNGFILYRIMLRNSPNFHVGVERTDGFTAWGVKIYTPQTARNTDGIDPSSSTNVTITHCDIWTGDDNVAIKASGAPSSHITISHNHFYYGHGMAIGSNTDGGVSAVQVLDLTMERSDNGIRIKSDRSRGGLVEGIRYQNVCMQDVKNPIVLTPMYTRFDGSRLPLYRSISLQNVHSLTAGPLTLMGLDAEHKLGVWFDNVRVEGLRDEQVHSANADFRIGPAQGNIKPRGDGVAIVPQMEGPGTPFDCKGQFPRFPVVATAPKLDIPAPPEDKTLYVAASGSGDFWSIQQAIDTAPAEGAEINIGPGTYREVLNITKPNMRLHGASADPKKTVIIFDKSAGTSGGTTNSATVNVRADGFSAENLTFANDWNAHHVQESQGSQALALLVTGDLAVFRNVRLLGNQDTLYAATRCGANAQCAPTRQYFTDCYIEGNVDFIFGDAKAFFKNCEIHNTPHNGGYVTAQGKHSAAQDSVYVFDHCKLSAEPGVEHVWLGRPWRPYASVVFLNTEMGAHIEPAGWREWHPGETHYMDTVFYAEYNSTGPGAHIGERDSHVKKLTAEEAKGYARAKVFDGWEPK